MNTETGSLFGSSNGTTAGRSWEIDDATAAVAAPPATLEVFQRASILQLQFRRLGTTRKVASDDYNVRPGDADTPDADKALVSAQKQILVSSELRTIERHDNATAAWVDTRKAGPAFVNQGGFHLVANTMQAEVNDYLDKRLDERQDLIDAFLAVFDDRIRETKRRLGPLARDTKFPTRQEAAATFGYTRAWFTLGYRDEQAANAWQADALAECRATLRAGFAEVVSKLAERLEPGQDGKPKIFRDSLVENFALFVETFERRNLANDGELAALVGKARAVMAGIEPEQLREQADLRRAVGRAVTIIDEAAGNLVMNKPTRRYGE